MKKQLSIIAIISSAFVFGCELDYSDEDFSGDDPADEEAWEVDVDEPTETEDGIPEGFQAAASDSCGGSRILGWNGSGAVRGRGDATISYSRRNGVTWVHDASYSVTNPYGRTQRVGFKWQVYRNGKWRNAADWMFYRKGVGTGSKSIGNGIRTNLPTRVQVLFTWEQIGPDTHKTCYIRTS